FPPPSSPVLHSGVAGGYFPMHLRIKKIEQKRFHTQLISPTPKPRQLPHHNPQKNLHSTLHQLVKSLPSNSLVFSTSSLNRGINLSLTSELIFLGRSIVLVTYGIASAIFRCTPAGTSLCTTFLSFGRFAKNEFTPGATGFTGFITLKSAS